MVHNVPVYMVDTVTRLGLWDWFKTAQEAYMFSNHPNTNKISSGLKNNAHSGATFAYCMRIMQSIANESCDKWILNKKT